LQAILIFEAIKVVNAISYQPQQLPILLFLVKVFSVCFSLQSIPANRLPVISLIFPAFPKFLVEYP